MTDFLFDGYPRTLSQAETLGGTLGDLGLSIVAVLNLAAPRDELLRRLTGRRTCKRCGATFHIHFNAPKVDGQCDLCGGKLIQRSDDNVEAVSMRLDAFEKATRPLLEYYAQAGLLVDIDATGQIYDVQSRVRAALQRHH